MKNYKGEVFNSILSGIPAILLFFLPLALYNIFQKKYFPAIKLKKKGILRYFTYSVLTMLFAILLANFGSSAERYAEQYKFDTATETFGLLTSNRL